MIKRKKQITVLDFVIIGLLLAVAGFILYRLIETLNYKWSWQIIPRYLFYYDEANGHWKSNLLMLGFYTTIKLTICSTLLATIFGFAAGLLRTSNRLFNRLVGGAYVELIRNVPPLVLIFIFYFFVSDQIMPMLGIEDFVYSLSPETQKTLALFLVEPGRIVAFISGVLTIAIFQGAYVTEIVRAGIQSISKGQWEASYALGLSWRQQMLDIIMPQAIRQVLPPLANEFINTMKWSSLVSIISIQELTFQAMQVMASTLVTIEVWLTVTAIYLVVCLSLSFCIQWLENRFKRSDA